MCTVNERHKVVFEIDTGASCNILPFSDYIRATGDKQGIQISPTRTTLTMHNNSKAVPMGKVMLYVERGGKSHYLCFFIMKSQVTPILGKSTCIGMKLIKILDCDTIHSFKEATLAYSTEQLKSDPILSKFADIFEGLGELPGEYKIQLKPDAIPIVNPPRRLPVALRSVVKMELDTMVSKEIITPVTEPTPWVSSMVVTQKKNGKIRICLDPQHLNKAMMRCHYPLPTIEEVATRLTNAKVFSVLDAKSGFWQVKLEEAASYLTTFNTPFGRFRWRRMPFGISSAPEVWQQRMNELVEGLKGVEVIADDFLICGFGATKEEAIMSHDDNLCCFLERARKRSLKLNPDKVRLRLDSVPFIGHLLTNKGLAPDPNKTSAVTNMPTPKNAKALQQLLGMVQYLSKFLPQLSTVTEPLRQLGRKDTDWVWTEAHDKAVTKIKSLISTAPVLRYFDPTTDITLQCDASDGGLGYALLQQGQPVAYGARGLTLAEKQYAQIEKEMLAIVCGCEKFDQYLYGHKVTVETDHKPLVSISQKSIQSAPKRLQRMLLQLQRYDVHITYKKGAEMYLADALSRAYPKNSTPLVTPPSEFCHAMAELQLAEHLPISTKRLKQIQEATSADHSLQVMMALILTGWPDDKSKVPSEVKPYTKYHDELAVQDGVIFKGSRIIVPTMLRREMIQKVHEGHLGAESCLRRAKEVFFWPLMNAEIRDYVSNCSICNTLRPSQCREPLKSHEVPERPWSRVATDLFSHKGENFIVIVDYYSNFIEMERIATTSSRSVIQVLKKTFSRHGIPESLVSDNGPAYASEEFHEFASKWEFRHVTTSPHYPQANGKAESAVKICKNLLKKSQLANSDVHLALLNHRNTPTEPTNTSPAQRLYGRRTRTLLPVSANLLKPETPQQVPAKLKVAQQNQAEHYNKRARTLGPLKIGDPVYLRLPGSTTWSLGVCKKLVAPRSYQVECNGTTYRRNRRHLQRARTNTPTYKPPNDRSDFESEREEEEDNDKEPEPAQDDPISPRPEPAQANDNPISPQYVVQQTSSFGRVIRPPRRFAELPDI